MRRGTHGPWRPRGVLTWASRATAGPAGRGEQPAGPTAARPRPGPGGSGGPASLPPGVAPETRREAGRAEGLSSHPGRSPCACLRSPRRGDHGSRGARRWAEARGGAADELSPRGRETAPPPPSPYGGIFKVGGASRVGPATPPGRPGQSASGPPFFKLFSRRQSGPSSAFLS